MKSTLTIIISSLSLIYSANPTPHYTHQKYPAMIDSVIVPPSLRYHYDSLKVTSAYRFDDNSNFQPNAYVRIEYPLFQNAGLNQLIKTTVFSNMTVKYKFKNTLAAKHPALSEMKAINEPAGDYQELADNFLKQFEDQARQEDSKIYWHADIRLKVLSNSPEYMSIVCKKDYFTGGLHDLYESRYLNYDVQERHLFTLTSQLMPGKLTQLKKVAEQIFRKNEGLNQTEVLEGYFFENQQFDLPDNFTITSRGLLFFYDYYEIKPFAAGTTELLIPFSDLRALALPNSILIRHIPKN